MYNCCKWLTSILSWLKCICQTQNSNLNYQPHIRPIRQADPLTVPFPFPSIPLSPLSTHTFFYAWMGQYRCICTSNHIFSVFLLSSMPCLYYLFLPVPCPAPFHKRKELCTRIRLSLIPFRHPFATLVLWSDYETAHTF